MALDPITAGFDFGAKLIERIWPDPTVREEAKLKLAEMQQNGELAKLTAETEIIKGQLEINAEEAKSQNIFVSGWRPFIGWVCGAAFAYTFIFQPFIVYIAKLCGSLASPPDIDGWLLFNVLGAMLGLGAMRSWEKGKGVTK